MSIVKLLECSEGRAFTLARDLRRDCIAKDQMAAAAQFSHMAESLRQAARAAKAETKRRHLGHAMVAFDSAKRNLAVGV
ncbi:hypothetical protein M2322_002643 [Rhodoblastus acidophilus]|uniref:hypothetical protein n=1 Tax=Rhodoblastus acidophilus TaxID=1074 RepID=UPI0022250E4C|nr:hypothetical protein [Rhodoblastus acidophilus]MCW2317089.1 hypothetical protein [Rhodoblastus acidophilus]